MAKDNSVDGERTWGAFSMIRTDARTVEIKHLYALSESDYRSLHQAVRRIAEANQGTGLFVIQALHDLEVSVAEVAEELLRGRIPPSDPEQLMDLVNYRVVMLSAAVRMFEEYVIAKVTRAWSDAPDRIEEVRRAFRAVYDSSLSYRILYALRNAAVHGAGTMVRVDSNVRALNASGEPKRNEVRLQVTLDRKAFASKQKIKSSIRQEVAALSEDLSLVLMGQEVRDRLLDLENLNRDIIFPHVTQSIEFLAPHFIRAWSAGSFMPNFHEYPVDRPTEFTSVVIARPVLRTVLQALGGDLTSDDGISVPVELAEAIRSAPRSAD